MKNIEIYKQLRENIDNTTDIYLVAQITNNSYVTPSTLEADNRLRLKVFISETDYKFNDGTILTRIYTSYSWNKDYKEYKAEESFKKEEDWYLN